MRLLKPLFTSSPILARVLPYVLFWGLTLFQGQFGEDSRYWIYLAKTLVGIWLIWEMLPYVAELRWAFSWEAVVVGIGVFACWVGITGDYTTQDTLWVKLGLAKPPATPATPWNPLVQFSGQAALGWLFVVVRILGSTFVVPPLEEAFYRSLLYRWIVKPEFMNVPFNLFSVSAFVGGPLIFGLSHNEWISGILCGMAYQWLVLRKNRLGDAMTAHAITNFLLGVWVVWRGAWNFW